MSHHLLERVKMDRNGEYLSPEDRHRFKSVRTLATWLRRQNYTVAITSPTVNSKEGWVYTACGVSVSTNGFVCLTKS